MAPIHFTVYDPIFRQPIVVLFGYGEDEMFAWLRKHYDLNNTPEDRHPSWEAQSFYMTAPGHPVTSVICFHYLPGDDVHTQSVLVHELSHTLIKLWDTDNVGVNLETQEFYCQAIGDLYELIWRKYAELRKKHGRKRSRKNDKNVRGSRRKHDRSGAEDQVRGAGV